MDKTDNSAKDISMTDNVYENKEMNDIGEIRKEFYAAKYCPLCPKNSCIIQGDIKTHLLEKHKKTEPSDILKIIVDEKMNVFGEICEEIFFLKCAYDIIAGEKSPTSKDERNMEAFKSQVRKYVNNMTCDAFIE